VPKKKLSVTVSPERLKRAREVSPGLNVSEVVDEALNALVDRELERRWLRAHQRQEGPPADLPQEVPVDLTDLPWDEE
jgi:post-segregation antitoxin (ccd killing protein)